LWFCVYEKLRTIKKHPMGALFCVLPGCVELFRHAIAHHQKQMHPPRAYALGVGKHQ